MRVLDRRAIFIGCETTDLVTQSLELNTNQSFFLYVLKFKLPRYQTASSENQLNGSQTNGFSFVCRNTREIQVV